jgi:hypothetical protein
MKHFCIFFLIAITLSCSKKQEDLTVKVNIKGLQKGTVYLKRFTDTTLVTVDSVSVSGQSQIELYSNLEEPDLFFLYLDKSSKDEDKITFFADKGVITITTTLKEFVADSKVEGSKPHKVLQDYQKLVTRLNNRNLDLIKEKFEAQKEGDSAALASIIKKQNSIIKNRYLQTVNFAINHKDSEVAPYLALSEIYNANTTLLDTIYKSLVPTVKNSKYGKELNTFLTKRKATK